MSTAPTHLQELLERHDAHAGRGSARDPATTMVVHARSEPTPWVQQFNTENVGFNLDQAHSYV